MQETKTSYQRMSESGRAMAEFIELSRRYDVIILHSNRVAGLKNAPKTGLLAANIQARYAKLTDAEKRAATAFLVRVVQFQSDLSNAWKQWLSTLLMAN